MLTFCLYHSAVGAFKVPGEKMASLSINKEMLVEHTQKTEIKSKIYCQKAFKLQNKPTEVTGISGLIFNYTIFRKKQGLCSQYLLSNSHKVGMGLLNKVFIIILWGLQ